MSRRSEQSEPAAPYSLDLEAARAWLMRDKRSRVIVDRELRVLWANVAARDELRKGLPIYLQNHRLCFANWLDHAYWRGFLTGADRDGRRGAIVCADGSSCMVLHAWSGENGSADQVFVTLALARPELDFQGAGLAEQFGLTRAESEVGERLATLATPAEIAASLGVSVNTVRTHIRRIYNKLSVRSQPQFMRVVHTYCGT